MIMIDELTQSEAAVAVHCTGLMLPSLFAGQHIIVTLSSLLAVLK